MRNFFKRLSWWFKNRRELVAMANMNSHSIRARIEELDQHKTYHIKADSSQEAHEIELFLVKLQDLIPWTMPVIIVTTKELKNV